MEVLVEYDENNSGGSWWLSKDNYNRLCEHGWQVTGNRNVSKYFDVPADLTEFEAENYAEQLAILEWEMLLQTDAHAVGCHCCGRPHNFRASFSHQSIEEVQQEAREFLKRRIGQALYGNWIDNKYLEFLNE